MSDSSLNCSHCGRGFATTSPAPPNEKVFCSECVRKHLRSNIQGDLLKDYAQFGCRNRSATAAHFGSLFVENPGEVQIRKYAALKVFEELVLATEDLCMLYFALRDRNEVPPLERLLTFNVDPKKSQQWRDELGEADEAVLKRLGFLDPGGRLLGTWNNQEIQIAALLTSIDAMRDAANDRIVGDGVLVQALNKLKHGFVATSLGNYIEPPANPDEHVAILTLDRPLGRLNRLVVEATEQKVSEMVETVASRADAAQCLLVSFVRIQG